MSKVGLSWKVGDANPGAAMRQEGGVEHFSGRASTEEALKREKHPQEGGDQVSRGCVGHKASFPGRVKSC